MMSRTYLSQLDKGAFYTSLKIIEKLAKVFEVVSSKPLKEPKGRQPR